MTTTPRRRRARRPRRPSRASVNGYNAETGEWNYGRAPRFNAPQFAKYDTVCADAECNRPVLVPQEIRYTSKGVMHVGCGAGAHE